MSRAEAKAGSSDAKRARVLVIEDDEPTRVLLARALQQEGHTAILASTGRAGLQLVRSAHPDLVLLDVMLPDISGLNIAESLVLDTKTANLPIVLLSALANESDRVRGLELGVDDYITKPFSLRELMLRIGIALRRRAPGPAPILDTGGIVIDSRTHRVSVEGKAIELTPIEFALLAALVGRAGHVHSREALLAEVWGAAPELATRTVDTHIKRLRWKLGDAAESVETVRGVGYRFRVADAKEDRE